MKKIACLFALPLWLYAHTLLMHVGDNDDGTLSIKGEFSTGESAAGALVKLKILGSEEILAQQRLPDSSELVLEIPKIPYEIILDGGPGHQVRREGIAPKGGFEKSEPKKNETSSDTMPLKAEEKKIPLALSLSLALAFILLLATIGISIYNTRLLLQKGEKRKA
ncbi:MAG: hypothetical protein EOL93_00815 [Epsilonproteobacteria bacterium]|nr:hypothetical protein [Campylobacterota bacterium]